MATALGPGEASDVCVNVEERVSRGVSSPKLIFATSVLRTPTTPQRRLVTLTDTELCRNTVSDAAIFRSEPSSQSNKPPSGCSDHIIQLPRRQPAMKTCSNSSDASVFVLCGYALPFFMAAVLKVILH